MPLIISTGSQRAAKTSRVQIGSQNLAFASWETRVSGADLPTVNFESYNAVDSETYGEGIMGVLSCDFSFGGAWDSGTPPLNNPPGLWPRDNLANARLYPVRAGVGGEAGDGQPWHFPYSRLRGATNSGSVEGLVLFNITDAKSQGRFTRPGQS